jgi:hypothetical protein
MSRSFIQDNLINSPGEFFLAKITAVGAQEGTGEDVNHPCSWKALGYYDSMRSLNSDDLAGYFWGDYTLDPPYNVAFPVSGAAPAVGDVVLMRLRGTREVNQNVFEFVSGGGGTAGGAVGCFTIKSLQCNNGILSAVFSDAGGCLSGCTSGLAFYTLNSKTIIPNNTNTPISAWGLNFGDLDPVGLDFSAGEFTNVFGASINIKVTIQFVWSPNAIPGTTRAGYVERNNTSSNIPLANFVASDDDRVIQTFSNFFNLSDGDTFKVYAFQNSGSNTYLGDPLVSGSTTLLIERLC